MRLRDRVRQWLQRAIGIPIRDWAGSVIQYNWCREIPVSAALGRNGIGTFLFIKPRGSIAGHVALSLGHGYTLEARARIAALRISPCGSYGSASLSATGGRRAT